MGNTNKELEQLFDAQGARAAQQPAATDVGSMQQMSMKPSAPSVPDPGKITQTYYPTPSTESSYESGRPVYAQSEAVQNAAQAYQQQMSQKPGEYVSRYDDAIQSMIDQALNRPAFQYDYAQDPMYLQYAQQYQRGGRMAMEDAMAQSAALTGGYGNSYAQQVGQQTYQGYMENLYNQLPELRNAAYQLYEAEGSRLRDQLNMLQTQEELDYGRYRDTVSDWRSDVDMLFNQYGLMSEAEYNRYLQDAAAWEADRAYWYQKAYDAQQQANWEKTFNAQYGAKTSGGGSGGSRRQQSTAETPAVTNQSILDLVASGSSIVNDDVIQQIVDMAANPPASAGFQNPLLSSGNRLYEDYDHLLRRGV